MKLYLPSSVIIVMVLMFSLLFAFWMDNSRKRLTMRNLDRQIFDGVGGKK